MAQESNAVVREVNVEEASVEEGSVEEDLGGQHMASPAEELAAENEDAPLRNRLSLVARLSSLLFVATKPLSVEQLAEAAGEKAERVEDTLPELMQLFVDETHGFSLQVVAGAYQFRTAAAAANYIHRLVPKTARKLSRAAAETLAVVAYKQPVQRAEIEAIRGVDALPTLKTLLDAKLIRIVGRENTAGHPALYGTTKTFLEKFGLNDLSELPSAAELGQLFDEPGEIEEDEDERAQLSLLRDDALSEDAHSEDAYSEDAYSEDASSEDTQGEDEDRQREEQRSED